MNALKNKLPVPGYILMIIIFLALGVSFLLDIWGDHRKLIDVPLVDQELIKVTTVRQPYLEAITELTGERTPCSECHDSMTPPVKSPSHYVESHYNIELDHGHNIYCYNCHHPTNRERLVDYEGEEISFAQSDILCQKCHGPTHRDWEKGIHGRLNGYWDTNLGPQYKNQCVACHDPHSPKFKPITPAPAPTYNHYYYGNEPGEKK